MSAEEDAPIHDLVGIGFGPSNLALAVALEEHNGTVAEPDRMSAVFFEKQPRFGWHRGMLIDGATMQVSFLKDLVTMRNPASDVSFLSYLHSKGRLVDFINHKTMFPTRTEFHDYLEWVARRFDGQVEYGCEVVAVRPVVRDDVVAYVDVVVQQGGSAGELVTCRARNVVLAVGLEPRLPPGVITGDRMWHNYDLLARLESLPSAPPRRFVVVGAGQSAAEVTEYLHRRFADAQVCALFSRYGYSPADDSSFANRIFDPDAVDSFYAAPADVKRMLLRYHGNTNYSVVDLELIDELYRRSYQEKVQGCERLRIMNISRLVDVQETGSGVRTKVEFLPTGETDELDADVVIYATGYRPVDPLGLLGEVAAYCPPHDQGGLQVGRDYRVATSGNVACGIYLQGATEHTHGISSSLLSNTATRAAEILRSIAAGSHVDQPESYALSGR